MVAMALEMFHTSHSFTESCWCAWVYYRNEAKSTGVLILCENFRITIEVRQILGRSTNVESPVKEIRGKLRPYILVDIRYQDQLIFRQWEIHLGLSLIKPPTKTAPQPLYTRHVLTHLL